MKSSILARDRNVDLPRPSVQKLFGLLAEFERPDTVLHGAKQAYAAGYRRMEAYSPFHIEGLAESLGHGPTPIPLFTLLGGMSGCLGGYFMQWYASSWLYPLNVGGRPLNSWPNFIPITFELTILIAALSALFSMLVLNRLPQLYHPVFNAPNFRRASIDRFFLCIESADPCFDFKQTHEFLVGLGTCRVVEVEQ